MKLKMSSINDFFSNPITNLSNSKKISKNLEKLIEAGYHNIESILWIIPLRIQPYPKLASFNELKEGYLFYGSAEVISRKSSLAFGFKGKGRVQLFNFTIIVRDLISKQLLTIKWFNIYPNQRKQINELTHLKFIGSVVNFNGQLMINNPKIISDIETELETPQYLIEYPTINSVPGKYIASLIDKISTDMISSIQDFLPNEIIKKNNLATLADSFKLIHGKINLENWTVEAYEYAKNRLIYQEFLDDQIKINIRRKNLKLRESAILKISNEKLDTYMQLFPFQLTDDQIKAIMEISQDMQAGHPMMRMIQGDVGCGKTSVAIVSSLIALQAKKQVAIMCPTEALARQHYITFSEIISKCGFTLSLLLGSHKTSEKNQIYKKLANNEINLIIGTHSLFQDKVTYSDLGLAIIDEQHKFGVEQRLRLLRKGENPHCITMTATPIPRTLRLTQYGDLDISFIRQMPKNRKGIKTRIVSPQTIDKFLSFIKTRIELNEQIYIVAPAIEESEKLDIQNVISITEKYQQYFPSYKIEFVHGKLESSQKDKILTSFKNNEFPVLVATSVIEVGIDNPQATVMAIYNPERFGLSSLHQLRGRVGRGDKTGFCFLVSENELPIESKNRLEILEKTNDGFKISEEDLKFRGEGDLFGVNQSGLAGEKRIANIFMHTTIFENVIADIKNFELNNNELIQNYTLRFQDDDKITKTI